MSTSNVSELPEIDAALLLIDEQGLQKAIHAVRMGGGVSIQTLRILQSYDTPSTPVAGVLRQFASNAIAAGKSYDGQPADYSVPADEVPPGGLVELEGFHTHVDVEFSPGPGMIHVWRAFSLDTDGPPTVQEIEDALDKARKSWEPTSPLPGGSEVVAIHVYSVVKDD